MIAISGALALIGLATVVLIAGVNALEQRERDEVWDSAMKSVSGKATVEGDSVSFESESKDDCDTDDFQKFNYNGGYSYKSTDWDKYEVCTDAADLAFALAAYAQFQTVEAFFKKVGLPSSLMKKVEQVRGLDGLQEASFETTRVGPVDVAYSYDGGNGLFVQVSRTEE